MADRNPNLNGSVEEGFDERSKELKHETTEKQPHMPVSVSPPRGSKSRDNADGQTGKEGDLGVQPNKSDKAENDDSAAAIAFKDPFADTTPRHPAASSTDNLNVSSRSGTKSPSPLNNISPLGTLHPTPSLGVQQLLSAIQPRDPLSDRRTPEPLGSDTVAYNNTSSSEEALRSLQHHSPKLPMPQQLQEQQQLGHTQANTGQYTHPSGDNTQTYDTPSAAHHPHRSLKPIVNAIMAFEKTRKFSTGTSVHRKRQMSTLVEKEGHFGPALTTLYLGISAVFADDHTAVVALAIHDTIYLVDFSVKHIELDDALKMGEDLIADYVISEVQKYEHENFSKFIGAGLPTTLKYMSPTLCSRLWLELDIVPIVMRPDDEHKEKTFWDVKRVDEQADSMARKCIMNFGPSLVPLLQVGFRGIVQIDAGFRAHLTTVQNHKDTCSPATWETTLTYAKKLRANKTKIAFFSSTPQGGGVALMRHALVRFARLLGVDLTWYVPKPRPGVFRITKNIHNILQGVSHPDQRVSADEKQAIIDWINENASRYWFSEGGPLCAPEEGGADVVVIDDPQMPGLIPLIKKYTPDRPVLYRSHIQIRSDLVAKAGSPQADIWDFLWSNIQGCDMFISHPIPIFVPHNVPREKVVYFPATTDWLDGLNKHLSHWDSGYYGHLYNVACHSQRMTELNWPARKYIIQVARFDPSKGIPTVIDSYAEFRRRCDKANITDVPQLVVCGNGSVDDPDASLIYDQTMAQLETYYPDLVRDVSVMRLDPNDQLINTLLANAHVVLQLSTREGFEVKVSEALHAGRPVIVSNVGGIPLQVKDKVNGFLVSPGDWRAVAGHLMELFTDDELWKKMSHAARTGVSDEVGTVGNALGWFYLAAKWTEVGVEKNGKGGLKGNEKWVNDMAREDAGYFYTQGENRLPRHFTQRKPESEPESNNLPIHEKKAEVTA